MEKERKLAQIYFEHEQMTTRLESELDRAIDLIIFEIDFEIDPDSDYPYDNTRKDWYDNSFELKGCKNDIYDQLSNLSTEKLAQLHDLGFERCWFNFDNPHREIYCLLKERTIHKK